jgi:hypothetical protein
MIQKKPVSKRQQILKKLNELPPTTMLDIKALAIQLNCCPRYVRNIYYETKDHVRLPTHLDRRTAAMKDIQSRRDYVNQRLANFQRHLNNVSKDTIDTNTQGDIEHNYARLCIPKR